MIYYILLGFLFILAFFFDYVYAKGNRKLFYIICLLFFILVSGLRWKVGGDTYSYQFSFENDVPTLSNIDKKYLFEYKWEPLFKILMSLCKTISKDFFVFQLAHSLILNILLFRFFKKYTKNVFTSLFIYAFFSYLYFNTEILRESLAIAIFTLMYDYYNKKDWKIYYILGIIALGFHTSAFITLLFPLFRNQKLNQKGIIALISVFATFTILQILLPINQVLALLGSSVADKYEYYSSVLMNINGMIYKAFLFVICPLIILKIRNKISFNSTNNFENILFIYFLLAILYVAISGFGRFQNYLVPMMIVYYADSLILILKHRKIKQYAFILLPLTLIIPFYFKLSYYTTSTDQYYQGTTNFSRYYPYSTVIEKKEYDFREIIYRQGMSDAYKNSLNR